MVAAEERAQVEAAMQRERAKAAKAESRRDRLRGVYRRHGLKNAVTLARRDIRPSKNPRPAYCKGQFLI